jgi:hypothetical protein
MTTEEFPWGTRLTARPLSDHPFLAIHADVHRNSTRSQRDIRITFTAPTKVLRVNDARTWVNAMSSVLARATELAESYVPKKKAAPKAAKKKK